MDQLPEDSLYYNKLGADFFQEPKLTPNHGKKLDRPIDAMYSFLNPLVLLVTRLTSKNLQKYGKKAITVEEMMQLIFFEIALKLVAPQISHFQDMVSKIRDRLLIDFGLKGTWPGIDRLQDIRSNLRAYDENSNEPGSEKPSYKIKEMVNIFNNTAKNTIQAAGTYCIDETLTKFCGRNPLLVKMPRKPAGQGILYHTFAMRNIPYSERMLLGKVCTEGGMKVWEICDNLLGQKIDDKGLPLIGDRGYTGLKLVRLCTERGIPYLGTIQNSYLGGDYPVFPKVTSRGFKRRSYTYRLQAEEIYITAYYDYCNKRPCIFISNFHTGELSMEYTSSHKDRPLVAEIYSTQMCGVDRFDQGTTFYDVSRKTNKWTTRVFENLVGFLLSNARVCYCLANNYPLKKYTIKKFYMDILHQAYKHAWPISKIEPTIKPPYSVRKTCNWSGCKYLSTEPCANDLCEKQACKNHSVLSCLKCLCNPNVQNITFRKMYKGIKITRCRQLDTNCKQKTTVSCASVDCARPICKTHRYKLCADCAFHLITPGNCSVKLKPRHIRLGQ